MNWNRFLPLMIALFIGFGLIISCDSGDDDDDTADDDATDDDATDDDTADDDTVDDDTGSGDECFDDYVSHFSECVQMEVYKEATLCWLSYIDDYINCLVSAGMLSQEIGDCVIGCADSATTCVDGCDSADDSCVDACGATYDGCLDSCGFSS